jgi:hypothetical protein
MKKNISGYLFFYLLFLFFCAVFFLYHKHSVGNDSTISEWLINYTGGFTRRGIIGQICIWFAENLNLSLRFVIFIFQTIILFIYFCSLFLFFNKINVNKIMLLSIFSPIFILYPIAEIEVLARKELFIFSFLLTYLLIKDKKIKSLFIFIVLPLCILIWEPVVYFFSFLMALEVINNKYKNTKEILFRGIYVFIPSIIIVIYIILNSISVENHFVMANYLKTNFNENCYMSCAAIKSKSTIYQQFNPLSVYNFEVVIRYILIMIIGFGPLLFLSYYSTLKLKKLFFFDNFNNLFTPQLILLSPVLLLFAMGYDWGRWVNISYVFANLFYFYLYKNNLISLNIIYPSILKKILSNRRLFIMVFIIFCFGWNQKTAITGDIASFPGYRIPIKIINKVLFNRY